MGHIRVARAIRAPLELVFETVSRIENFANVVPEIERVEFLSDTRHGVGARFRETRRMGKRVASVELEVTEFVENERVRIVSDEGGTVWDSLFSVRPVKDGEVELVLEMEDRPYKLAAKMGNALIRGMLRRAIEKDLEAVRVHCESQAGRTASEPGR